MTNIGVLRTFRTWVQKLTLFQELGLLMGVILFFFGMSAEDSLWKLVFLGLSASAVAYVIVSIRSGNNPDALERDEQELTTEDGEDRPMAKIIFDDVNNPGASAPNGHETPSNRLGDAIPPTVQDEPMMDAPPEPNREIGRAHV